MIGSKEGRTMKKIIITLAAVAAAFTMASCNKEQLVEQGENTALGNCIITASTESNLTKTSLYGNDTDGYEVVWSEGEHAVIRCRRGWEQQTTACAAVITKLCGSAAVFRTVAVSGTVHGVKNYIKSTTWDNDSLPGYRCSGKKVDSLEGNNTQQYLTRDDIHKE